MGCPEVVRPATYKYIASLRTEEAGSDQNHHLLHRIDFNRVRCGGCQSSKVVGLVMIALFPQLLQVKVACRSFTRFGPVSNQPRCLLQPSLRRRRRYVADVGARDAQLAFFTGPRGCCVLQLPDQFLPAAVAAVSVHTHTWCSHPVPCVP